MTRVDTIELERIRSLLGDPTREVLQTVAEAIKADEASVWVKCPETESLVMILNSSSKSLNMEMKAEQDFESGLVSQVFQTGDAFIDPHSLPTRIKDNAVDIEFEQSVHYMAIVPLVVAGKRVGVIAGVQFARVGERIRKASDWGFSKNALDLLNLAVGEVAEKFEPPSP